MKQNIIGSVFWQFKVGKIDFSDLIGQCTKTELWDCTTKTTFNTQPQYDWNVLLDKVKDCLQQLPFCEPTQLNFQTPWLNVYQENDYQELHNHLGTDAFLSYCYFSKLPKDSGQFRFYNEMHDKYCLSGFNKTLSLPHLGLTKWIVPQVEEGDLIIFPSYLLHKVTMHKSNETRITASGNIQRIG